MKTRISRVLALLPCAALMFGVITLPAPAEAASAVHVSSDITSYTRWYSGNQYYICLTEDGDPPKITNGASLSIGSNAEIHFS